MVGKAKETVAQHPPAGTAHAQGLSSSDRPTPRQGRETDR